MVIKSIRASVFENFMNRAKCHEVEGLGVLPMEKRRKQKWVPPIGALKLMA
jgi:hypothetical protein